MPPFQSTQFVAGILVSLGALMFSALGSVSTKMISGRVDKVVIASYIGFSILAVGMLSFLTDPILHSIIELSAESPETIELFQSMPFLEDYQSGFNVTCVVDTVVETM